MIAELGQIALALALVLALTQTIFPVWGSINNTPSWMRLGKFLAWGQFLFTSLAFSSLLYCFLNDDFSVQYVAYNSNT
ncbi:hypothetical protein TI04_12780, partial [Achromatium sp. WMS2]